jgi:hypothetical protein
MRGLLASVLGGVSKGVGQVATDQIAENSRKALMEAEEEMRARLAEAAEGRAETRNIAAEERRLANIPREAEATAASEESVLSRRFGEGSAYPGLIRQQTAANETEGQRLEQQRTQGLLDDDQQVRDARQTLATMDPNDPQYQVVKRQLEILTGGTARLDPLVAAEIEDLQYQTRRATADYEKAVSDYDPDAMAAAGETLDKLQVQRERLFGRTSNTGGVVTINTQEEYDRLPSGAQFIEDGKLYTKP